MYIQSTLKFGTECNHNQVVPTQVANVDKENQLDSSYSCCTTTSDSENRVIILSKRKASVITDQNVCKRQRVNEAVEVDQENQLTLLDLPNELLFAIFSELLKSSNIDDLMLGLKGIISLKIVCRYLHDFIKSDFFQGKLAKSLTIKFDTTVRDAIGLGIENSFENNLLSTDWIMQWMGIADRFNIKAKVNIEYDPCSEWNKFSVFQSWIVQYLEVFVDCCHKLSYEDSEKLFALVLSKLDEFYNYDKSIGQALGFACNKRFNSDLKIDLGKNPQLRVFFEKLLEYAHGKGYSSVAKKRLMFI